MVFKFNDIKEFKKIGKIDIGDKLAYGEIDYSSIDVKKGSYDIYKINDNLILSLSSNTLTKDLLKDIQFTNTSEGVGVDGGTFGFFDEKSLDLIDSKGNVPIFEEKIYLEEIKTPKDIIEKKWYDLTYNIGFLVKYKYIEDLKKIQNNIDENKIIGVMMNTGTGDGFFPLYENKEKNIYMLMGGFTYDDINCKQNEQEGGSRSLYYKKYMKYKTKYMNLINSI
ncbi:MAG: hypothetical protein Terrestrivirus1_73 [Terrestrivirus sp.]|uniref:Uncharacterized protein n=1 Tax=Terrestrivirus sp. TaxID=2487775 RepID=A0A3G4ZP07_9VIRU|nr:MAG: hypothetical protein Terrestrivirus1_73 [Terrestrivirus sp.]